MKLNGLFRRKSKRCPYSSFHFCCFPGINHTSLMWGWGRNVENEGHNLNGVNVASYHKALQLSLPRKIQAIKLKPNVLLSEKLPPAKIPVNLWSKTGWKGKYTYPCRQQICKCLGDSLRKKEDKTVQHIQFYNF